MLEPASTRRGPVVPSISFTSASGPGILAGARRRGVDVIGETCPHYLLVDREDRRIALAKYNPAVKWKTDREALWVAVGGDGIDCLGSDHIASAGMEEQFMNKEKDIWAARAGLSGSGTILFTLLDGVRQKRLSFERLVALTSYNPARAFGLFPRKGHIGVGRARGHRDSRSGPRVHVPEPGLPPERIAPGGHADPGQARKGPPPGPDDRGKRPGDGRRTAGRVPRTQAHAVRKYGVARMRASLDPAPFRSFIHLSDARLLNSGGGERTPDRVRRNSVNGLFMTV